MIDYLAYFKTKFRIEELVPRSVHVVLGEAAWNLFDPNLLKAAGWLRWRYDKDNPDAEMVCGGCTINDWLWGGQFEWSGIRLEGKPYWSDGSMHSVKDGKLCMAFDMKLKGIEARTIIDDLKRNKQNPYITRIEDKPGITWVHIDTKPTKRDGIYFFKP